MEAQPSERERNARDFPSSTPPPLPHEKRLEYAKQVLESVCMPQRPPADFNPLHATPAELELYALPPRPVNTEQAAKWEHLMSKQMEGTFIEPSFQVCQRNRTRLSAEVKTTEDMTKTTEDTVKATGDTVKRTGGIVIYNSKNWAGAVISGGDELSFIAADWLVPTPNPGSGTKTAWFSDTWIGLDGWPSSDILQGGTAQDVYIESDQSTSRDIYAWYEWYPAYPIIISNFTVNAGDSVLCVVWSSDQTTGNFYIYNFTSGKYTYFRFNAPSGYWLRGDSAGWIVEDPSGNSLANFGSVELQSCWAMDRTMFKNLADADRLVYMYQPDGTYCTAKVMDDTTLKVTYGG